MFNDTVGVCVCVSALTQQQYALYSGHTKLVVIFFLYFSPPAVSKVPVYTENCRRLELQ